MVAPALEPFVRQRAVLLTTYRRDGRPVGTPVSIAVDEDRAFFRTWDTTGKFKRIRNNPEVEVAPHSAWQAHGSGDPRPRQGAERRRVGAPQGFSPTSTRSCTASSFPPSITCAATRRYIWS